LHVKLHAISEEEPYARIILRHLRDFSTHFQLFREWLRRAGLLLGFKIARSLLHTPVKIRTPLGEAEELQLLSPPLVVSVLGAGHFLAEGILEAYPGAPLGFVAARRIEKKDALRVEISYRRLPREWRGPAIIADPMLATGMTIESAIGLLTSIGSKPLIVASVISAPEGVERLSKLPVDIEIYTLALDKGLDANYFIVPGLGDAGDRSLGISV